MKRMKRIEQGAKGTQQKQISDEKFAKLSAEYNEMRRSNDERMAANIKRLHYRKDTGMKEGTLIPLVGGRVGGLALPVKKWKKAKRQLGRTKHSTVPIGECAPWEDRFYVRKERSTELFCDKVWPKKLSEAEKMEEAMEQLAITYGSLNQLASPGRKASQPSPRTGEIVNGKTRPATSPAPSHSSRVSKSSR